MPGALYVGGCVFLRVSVHRDMDEVALYQLSVTVFPH